MRSDNEGAETYDGQGLKGPLYWLASAATASAIKGPGGILGNLLGGNPPPPPPGMEPVTQKTLDLTAENQELKAKLYANELNTVQVAWNAKQEGRIDCLKEQVAELRSAFRLMLPNSNLAPGVGPVQVVPVPAPAPDVTALASAIVAAMPKTTQQGQQG